MVFPSATRPAIISPQNRDIFFMFQGTLDFYKAYRFPPEIVQQAMALSPVYSEGARADSLDES
jgi:hypothetical protein